MNKFLIAVFLLSSTHGRLRAAPLSLTEAIREAMKRSPEVEEAEHRMQESLLEEPLILSELDPKFESGFSAADDQAPRAAPVFQGTRAQTQRWQAGILQQTLLGTQMRLQFANERLTNPAAFRVLDPSVDSRLSLDLSQPLMRYLLGRPDVARRKRAGSNAAAAELQLRAAREKAATEASRAFLDLYLAVRQTAVKKEGVHDAKKLLAKYQEKKRYGLAEESDLLQAGASLEAQKTELLLARSQIKRATHALLAALGRKGELETLELAEPKGLPDGAAIAMSETDALARRADVAAARRLRESLEWSARIQRLDALPELNLTASYGVAGLGGRYHNSWNDLGSMDHAVKSAGIHLIIPLTFKKERLLRRKADLQFEAAKAAQAQIETTALRELRDAQELHRLATQRLDAGRRLVELEKAKYRAEEANFRRGKSSTDLLIRFQQDIRRAQSELLRAEADEAFARIDLARTSGALLEIFPP